MDNILNLHNLILQATRISIAVHTHPDGDALGSGIGLTRFLTDTLGKDAMLVLPDEVPPSLAFMLDEKTSGRVKVFSSGNGLAQQRISESDLIFVLDCNSPARTASLEDSVRSAAVPKVLVDHHLSPETEVFDLVFSRTEISSASEVLFWILMELPEIKGDAKNLPAASATALMTGLTTDTNNFGNSVFPSTLKMASMLIEAGVDRDNILSELYNRYRENRLRLMGYMLGDNMKITEEGVAYMILDKQTQERFDFQQGESEGFVNLPLSIDNVRMSILLTEESDKFRVSVRSKKGVSANTFAKDWYNGGGHELAAGGRLFFPGDIEAPEQAETYILKSIGKFFND